MFPPVSTFKNPKNQVISRMVFRKYRAVKQWGKMDTRIFKEICNSRNKRKMPSFEIPEAVKALNVAVYEPNDKLKLVPFYNPHKFDHSVKEEVEKSELRFEEVSFQKKKTHFPSFPIFSAIHPHTPTSKITASLHFRRSRANERWNCSSCSFDPQYRQKRSPRSHFA